MTEIMKDNLKEFIQTHREEFDDQLAPELWASISVGIKPPSHLFINLKKLANMFKYAFGASALIIGTFFIIESLKNNQTSYNLVKTQISVATNPVEEKKSPELMQSLPTTQPLPSRVKEKSSTLSVMSSEQKKEVSLNEIQKVPASNPALSPSSMISHPAVILTTDSFKTTLRYQMDTLFKGVKHLVVNGNFCEVNVHGKDREDVSFKANLKDNAGNVLIFGKTILKKEEAKIRFILKDSTLTVWIEMQKLEHRERSKKEANDKSELNFEVPLHTDVTVKNQSGDIEVKNITSPKMSLESSFGEVEAENIMADLLVKVASGDIELNAITGQVQTSSSFGKQTITDVKGNLVVTSSSGDIVIKQLRGNANITTSFGNQTFQNIAGNITAVASSGNVEVENLKGDLVTRTSFGNQDLDNIEGNITAAASSGDIDLEKSKGTFILNTTFGNIIGTEITLLNNSNFTSSSGDIRMQLANDISELSFDLASSSGDLEIKKGTFESRSEKKLVFDRGPIKIKGVSSFGNQHYK
jgi:hypothetical protein